MSMLHGVSKEFDTAFAAKHAIEITNMGTKETLFKKGSYLVHINYVQGDCTAATLYFSENPAQGSITTFFPILIEYLSANARISAYFSFKVWKESIPKVLKLLRTFHIAGLNVQKSNRNPEHDTYQISGLLKVTSPLVRDYRCLMDLNDVNSHNPNEVAEYNELNKLYKCKTFRK